MKVLSLEEQKEIQNLNLEAKLVEIENSYGKDSPFPKLNDNL